MVSTSFIAVAGSADPRRHYDPSLTHSAEARAAAAEIGRELARKGCGIVVYSSDPRFIEADVVRGYASSSKRPAPGQIQVRAPQSADSTLFPEMETNPELFDLRPDVSDDWEVAFYRSLPDVEGVVLIGGGRSVLITGLIALMRPLPIVSVATFGGAALKVWQLLAHDATILETGDLAAMAAPTWEAGSAARLVESLMRQRRGHLKALEEGQRTLRRNQRLQLRQSTVAMLLFVASVVTLPLGLGALRPDSSALLFLLFFAPLLAGASGATVRMVSMPYEARRRTFATVALGLIAGGISALLFLVSQLAASPDLLTGERTLAGVHVRGLLIFAVVVGFIAGFTFDTVYRRLAKSDVVRLDGLEQP